MKRASLIALLLASAAGCGDPMSTDDAAQPPDLSDTTTPDAAADLARATSPDLAGPPGDFALPPCGNSVKDGDETDIDCGGGTCAPCAARGLPARRRRTARAASARERVRRARPAPTA